MAWNRKASSVKWPHPKWWSSPQCAWVSEKTKLRTLRDCLIWFGSNILQLILSLDTLVRPHLSWQENTMPVPQLSVLPGLLLLLFVSINTSRHSLFFSPQAKILGKVLCLHADRTESKARWQGRKFLSSRSNILEVGCQGVCEIWSFRDWMKETLR